MPHYLSQVSYTPEAWARLVANPHDRIEAVRGPISAPRPSPSRLPLAAR